MSASAAYPILGGPPPIPAAREVGPPAYFGHVLLWVHTGSAIVHLVQGPDQHLGPGEGIWFPAGGILYREIETRPGTVAFPLWSHADILPEGGPEPHRFKVPRPWRRWLIQRFSLLVTPLSTHAFSEANLADLLTPSGEHTRTGEGGDVGPTPPPLPHTPPARAVAEELLRTPALNLTVAQWATRVLSSPTTLRRAFRAETGLTFEQWRLSCRLTVAVDCLAAGMAVDQVAVRVGFGSRNGFTRAFKTRYGITPHEFPARPTTARPTTARVPTQAGAPPPPDALVRLLRGHTPPGHLPRPLPAAHTPRHANPTHVLTWMYRGAGRLRLDRHQWEQDQGVVTCIPAETEHAGYTHAGSVLLPLGDIPPGKLPLAGPLQVHFPSSWENYLLFCAVSARSNLRPDNYDPAHILDLFRTQLAAQRALKLPLPRDPAAHSVAIAYLSGLGTGGAPGQRPLPPAVHRAFRVELGTSFASWCYTARMSAARGLLAEGSKPSAVAVRVGYLHLSNFSAAFARFHGISPREFQRRAGLRG